MKRRILQFGLVVVVCLSLSALADTVYSFQTAFVPGDTFTQLLGINKFGTIAGYHGSGATGHPNKGFLLTLPNKFMAYNFPGSAQTQVIGINKGVDAAGSIPSASTSTTRESLNDILGSASGFTADTGIAPDGAGLLDAKC